MASFNKVILMGNLTRDPQLSYLPSQTPVVEVGLAVNRRFRTNDGQQREDTCFIDCRAMGKQAETINQYLRKGSPILIEGRLEFDQWEAQDGTKRSKHRVFIERFTFVGGPAGGAPMGGGYQQSQSGYNQPAPAPAPQAQTPAPQQQNRAPMPQQPPYYEEDSPGGEDIPF
ncbi:MAG TPA: single-stranded DNA-binding protein [Phycisphaerae bacterium]|nr:single-stranded DNA-binding protein [Phycisphaerae bacterium]HPS52981.1 single-stranded DNA-binding protein [Phycisphaerae bacterium]